MAGGGYAEAELLSMQGERVGKMQGRSKERAELWQERGRVDFPKTVKRGRVVWCTREELEG